MCLPVMIAFVFHSFQGDGLDGAGRDVVARLELHRRKHVPEKNRHARCLAHFIAVGHHKVLLVGYLFGYLIKQFRVFDVAIFRDGQVLRVVGIPGKKSQFFAGRPVVWCPGSPCGRGVVLRHLHIVHHIQCLGFKSVSI